MSAPDPALQQALLSEADAEALIISLATARGDRGFGVEDAQRLLDAVREVRFWNAAINVAITGGAFLDIDRRGGLRLVSKQAHHIIQEPPPTG